MTQTFNNPANLFLWVSVWLESLPDKLKNWQINDQLEDEFFQPGNLEDVINGLKAI